jgi:prepilin-type N-terminal cleavage/methylation domain-containing protein
MNFCPGAAKKNSKNNRGFTLIEVLAAVVILGLAYVAALQSFSLSLKNIHRLEAKRSEIADALLAFEEKSRFTGESDDEEEVVEGVVFLEGHKYNLVVITDDSAGFTTMTLERSL